MPGVSQKKAGAKGHTPQLVLYLVQRLQLRGLMPNVVTYNAAISACEKGQPPHQARHLLQDIYPQGLLPNVITYNAAILACRGKAQNRSRHPHAAPENMVGI